MNRYTLIIISAILLLISCKTKEKKRRLHFQKMHQDLILYFY